MLLLLLLLLLLLFSFLVLFLDLYMYRSVKHSKMARLKQNDEETKNAIGCSSDTHIYISIHATRKATSGFV